MLYADDLVVAAETEGKLQRRMQEWHISLERGLGGRGLRENANRMKILDSCKAGDVQCEVEDACGC